MEHVMRYATASIAISAAITLTGCEFDGGTLTPASDAARLEPTLAAIETATRELEDRARESGAQAAESVADSIADAAETARNAITVPLAQAQAQGLDSADTAASVIAAATAEASRQGWLGEHGELIAFGVAGILGALGIGKYRADVTRARFEPAPHQQQPVIVAAPAPPTSGGAA